MDKFDGELTHVFDAGVLAAKQKLAEHTVVVPEGYAIKDQIRLADEPRRIEQVTIVHTLDSFLRYYNIFAENEAAIFAQKESGRITAVFDFHTEPRMPGWKDHSLTYTMPPANPWVIWNAKNGGWMGQVQFAEFIEDNIDDITDPDGATMLEIAKNLSATRKAKFNSRVNLSNGDQEFKYETETVTGTSKKGALPVPEMFEVGLQPFEGGPAYKIPVRLRYRIDDEGHLSLCFKMVRPKVVRDAAFDEVIEKLRASTNKTRLFVGDF